MRVNEASRKLLGRGAIALAALSVGLACASELPSPAVASDEPLVLAQAATATSPAGSAADIQTFPSYEAGVRTAAAQGSEALRRYVHRTRMIYNFYYWDYAPRN